MIERRPPFGIEDLPAADVAGDLTGSLALGRELDALATEPTPPVAPGWVDGVMAALAAEPSPQPVVAAGNALRAGRAMALVAAIGDAWRVGFGSGRPALVRLPALALVLVAVVAAGSVATIGGYAGARAVGLIPDAPPPAVPLPTPSPTPAPTPTTPPTSSPSPPPAVGPTPSVTPQATPTQSPSAGETDEIETPEPSDENDDGSGDNSGPGSGNSGRGSGG